MPLKPVLQLILASLLWGLGFVASSWSIRTFTSIESVTYRFLIAALLGQLVLFLMTSEKAHFHFKDFIKALPAGILPGLMQLTQTIGLETTTSGKSAFITSLYILFVPLISSLFLKESYKKINYIFNSSRSNRIKIRSKTTGTTIARRAIALCWFSNCPPQTIWYPLGSFT